MPERGILYGSHEFEELFGLRSSLKSALVMLQIVLMRLSSFLPRCVQQQSPQDCRISTFTGKTAAVNRQRIQLQVKELLLTL